jgi:alpha-tubulin suppressor-like RCC1 family protein
VEVVAGATHTCARNLGDEVLCWGSNSVGQLGIGDLPYRSTPSKVGEWTGWSEAWTAFGISCGLRGQEVYCWGGSSSVAQGPPLTPTAIPGSFIDVRPQFRSICGIGTGSGLLVCLQDDGNSGPNGSIGERFTEFSKGDRLCAFTAERTLICVGSEPTVYEGDWLEAATGSKHSCGIKSEGGLYCWGENDKGELGLRGPQTRFQPTRVGEETWLAVAVTNGRTCGIEDEGGKGPLSCWGQSKPLGPTQKSTPSALDESQEYTTLSLDDDRGCAIRSDQTLWCWGDNRLGKVGVGTSGGYVHTPTQVGTDSKWNTVTVGRHSCATTVDGEMYCWGSGRFGELGEGSAHRYEPTAVAPPE